MLKQLSEENKTMSSLFSALLLQENNFCRHQRETKFSVRTGGESLIKQCLKGAVSCLGAWKSPHALCAKAHQAIKNSQAVQLIQSIQNISELKTGTLVAVQNWHSQWDCPEIESYPTKPQNTEATCRREQPCAVESKLASEPHREWTFNCLLKKHLISRHPMSPVHTFMKTLILYCQDTWRQNTL